MTDAHLTDYGFQFGAALVERIAEFRGTTVVRVTGDTGKHLDIYISRTGRSMRVFKGGKELFPDTTETR